MIYADIKYSKELKDLFPESDFWHIYYARGTAKGHCQYEEFLRWYIMDKIPSDYEEILPALTTDMLLERLPIGYTIYKAKYGYSVFKDGKIEEFTDKSLPNALAKMLIYFKDNGLLKDGK